MVSSDSEDDLIAYGTPLEPLEENEIPTKKPRLIENQIVTDQQGRRRFHGAFTGGFSAGFFNTVGSLEGWTPSSFKSSKSNKQEISQRRPEDYMDEEDLSVFGIAPLVLKAKQDYRNENKKDNSTCSKYSTLGTYVLQNLLKPVRETIGMKLLKKMGWKPGQGVGPRQNKADKKVTSVMRQKIYGCQLPNETEVADENSDSEWNDVEFAPNDYFPLPCETRTNLFGLGYQGLDKRPILTTGQSSIKEVSFVGKTKKLSFTSQAFGVGAFEEEDEDIYMKDDMSRYDFSLEDDTPGSSQKPIEHNISSMVNVLEGFVLETKKRILKNHPLPILPVNYKARHRIKVSRFDLPEKEKVEEKTKSTKMNADDRSRLLHTDNEKTVEAAKRKNAETKALILEVKLNESKFKPFNSNPEKQERYEHYLKLSKIGQKDRLSDLQPLTMSIYDKEREKLEFEKASILFKPLSGGMEDRFLTASQPDDLSDPLAVVEKYSDENDDRRKAAKMNMYGPLTRLTEDWVPAALLCKRFNIPEPKKGIADLPERKREKSTFNLFEAAQNFKEISQVETESKSLVSEENSSRDFQRFPKEQLQEPAVTTEISRSIEALNENASNIIKTEDKDLVDIENKTDLFKAIFLGSDSEEEGNDQSNNKETQRLVKLENADILDNSLFEEKIINSQRNLSPPRGIFQNIDLALLSSKKEVSQELDMNKRLELRSETNKTIQHDDLMYGPKIPEKVLKKISVAISNLSDDDCNWVEKKVHSEKKHKKKNRKHKSKHKHKKHKR